MKSHGSVVLCAVCAIVCFAAGMAYAQQPTASADVDSVIGALWDAPAYERADRRADVVKLGDVAVDRLVGAVGNRQNTEDVDFTANCIMALGELRAAKATTVLVQVLGEGDLRLAYPAANSLGQIWQGKGPQDPQVKPVNAALLGLLHSELPAVAVYAPALALLKINDIALTRPDSMPADRLRDNVSEWFTRNPAALPTVQQQPWQLNVYVALKGTDAGARQQAVQALRQHRQLSCIEPILSAVADGTVPQDAAGSDLVKLVGELTGVPFPPAGVGSGVSPKEQVAQWRWRLWFPELATQTDSRHVDYALRGLEDSLRRYAESPSQEAAEPVKFFRAALLNQLPGSQAMPANVSPKARELLAESLVTKEVIAEAVAALEEQSGPFEKATQLKVIEQRVREARGREVAALFLGRLYELAYQEQNVAVATQMGDVISRISGIPCDLSRSQIEARRPRLDEWLKDAQRLGLAAGVAPH